MTDPIKCTKCGEWKSPDGFFRDNRRSNGRRCECKLCHKDLQDKRRGHGKYGNHQYVPPENHGDGRKCCRCKKWKPFEEMAKNRSRADGMDDYCYECRREIHAESRARKKKALNANRALRATCISDPTRVYTGRTVAGFRETLKFGYWPEGSIWEVRGELLKVVGVFENQRTVSAEG